ncbi:MAG: family 16 glycosylhydrolase [Chloroflexota bacterium]|nr:family 16 glycosylhydrolase [Chloroflexota bacterium]MDE2951196.1 family 16 glycosylhydrolase [Chloroflexota bacterium]
MSIPLASSACYHNAQISDYHALEPRFGNRPPLRLSLLARGEGAIRGTAGFGFWNQVFVPGRRRFRLPQAIWFFFGSPANDIALARGVPGHGWKAATINARGWRFYGLLPFAPLGFLAMRSKRLYQRLWPAGQRAIGVCEAPLDSALLQDFHRYAIDWHADRVLFSVDDEVVLRSERGLNSALGFIAWVDNQYAIVTPQGRFGWGLLDCPEAQKLILRDIEITGLA